MICISIKNDYFKDFYNALVISDAYICMLLLKWAQSHLKK